jgi:adenine-specific DNA-methyltransferase
MLRHVSLERLHVFESRDNAFRDDDVLQENIILHALKGVPQQPTVLISQSRSPEDPTGVQRIVPFEDVIRNGDPEVFIHFVPDDDGHAVADAMRALPCTLDQLGLWVSTGRVVDFRARDWLRPDPTSETVPLIYPTHFESGVIRWPKLGNKKPNAIVHNAESDELMVPAGVYVLVKRFTAKEERRRIVAAVFDDHRVLCRVVGFENHLNYFHNQGSPLDKAVAWGLSAFLNSSQVDTYFRQFNGNTQVNATDLRALRYPHLNNLIDIGRKLRETLPPQESIDQIVSEIIKVH